MPIPSSMWRSRYATEEKWAESAAATVDMMCRHLGVVDMSSLSMLDVGCGTKLTTLFRDKRVPIHRYVGVDVYKDMIDHLNDHITDKRFAYRHVDLHNEMYNPQGRRMSECDELPLDEQFDVISLFSVFTHLAPHDFGEMLRLLRPLINDDGRLFFSLYLNERTPGGYGFIDKMSAAGLEQAIRDHPERLEQANGVSAPPFVDFIPHRPLEKAVYSREYAVSLVDESDWEIESLNQPEWFIQHHLVCRPG